MSNSVALDEVNSAQDSGVAEEVFGGLAESTKRISPKYFYDRKGSELFDLITELEEYYVPRVEADIFRHNRASICQSIGAGARVMEPGAGSCEKIRWLLPELQPSAYVPMDISGEHLQDSADALRQDFPAVSVEPLVCDHTAGLDVFDEQPDQPVVWFYPGSSIGNFEPEAAVGFMREMREQMDARGGLLIGVDTKKDTDVLHAAYNDRKGVTARFNINVLDHLNDLLGGDLDTGNFSHYARYDEQFGRIEMYLRSKKAHSARLGGRRLDFEADELIHTENSYKYHPEEFSALADRAGFRMSQLWQDSNQWFSVMYFSPAE